MKILILDNYDSFTYNLVHIVESIDGVDIAVHRNDKISLEDVAQYDKVLLSPGPGIPQEAGILMDIIKYYGSTKSILGICLGHQAIALTYGMEIYNMSTVLHGVATPIYINDSKDYLFEEMENTLQVGRYHSWAVKDNPSAPIEVIARDADGLIMALRHKIYDVRGVQFHPESILTPQGKKIIENWVNY